MSRVSRGAGRQQARQGRSCPHPALEELLLMPPSPCRQAAFHGWYRTLLPSKGTTQTSLLPAPAPGIPNQEYSWHPTDPLSSPLTYLKERTMAVTIPVTMTTMPSTQNSPGHDVKST